MLTAIKVSTEMVLNEFSWMARVHAMMTKPSPHNTSMTLTLPLETVLSHARVMYAKMTTQVTALTFKVITL
jgi:hypothetical protein